MRGRSPRASPTPAARALLVIASQTRTGQRTELEDDRRSRRAPHSSRRGPDTSTRARARTLRERADRSVLDGLESRPGRGARPGSSASRARRAAASAPTVAATRSSVNSTPGTNALAVTLGEHRERRHEDREHRRIPYGTERAARDRADCLLGTSIAAAASHVVRRDEDDVESRHVSCQPLASARRSSQSCRRGRTSRRPRRRDRRRSTAPPPTTAPTRARLAATAPTAATA